MNHEGPKRKQAERLRATLEGIIPSCHSLLGDLAYVVEGVCPSLQRDVVPWRDLLPSLIHIARSDPKTTLGSQLDCIMYIQQQHEEEVRLQNKRYVVVMEDTYSIPLFGENMEFLRGHARVAIPTPCCRGESLINARAVLGWLHRGTQDVEIGSGL